MDNPSDLLRRAARNRASAPARDEPQPRGEPTPRAEYAPHHANYEALMRSHDRVRERHLPVQGGAGRA